MHNLNIAINDINKYVSQFTWLDFEVNKYGSGELMMAASTDFSYYHQLEVYFSKVRFYSGAFEWGTNPKEEILFIMDDKKILEENKIYDECAAVKILTDDNTSVIIGCSSIHFNTDTVFYYKRENLKNGERLADWVLKENR
ncbi:hypothetical protein ACJJIF_18285 [Microbulbifer sp. SSSA002]|uniref:hypothetical protein n=1 Tax=Microbulbifer sp. SSSA002 TaxID=3243376 RepID=UPI0040393372